MKQLLRRPLRRCACGRCWVVAVCTMVCAAVQQARLTNCRRPQTGSRSARPAARPRGFCQRPAARTGRSASPPLTDWSILQPRARPPDALSCKASLASSEAAGGAGGCPSMARGARGHIAGHHFQQRSSAIAWCQLEPRSQQQRCATACYAVCAARPAMLHASIRLYIHASMWILSGADRELVQCTNFIPNKESEKLLRIRT